MKARAGERVASLRFARRGRRLRLTDRVRSGDGELEDVPETVRIVRVACSFAGSRPFFTCPSERCRLRPGGASPSCTCRCAIPCAADEGAGPSSQRRQA